MTLTVNGNEMRRSLGTLRLLGMTEFFRTGFERLWHNALLRQKGYRAGPMAERLLPAFVTHWLEALPSQSSKVRMSLNFSLKMA